MSLFIDTRAGVDRIKDHFQSYSLNSTTLFHGYKRDADVGYKRDADVNLRVEFSCLHNNRHLLAQVFHRDFLINRQYTKLNILVGRATLSCA